MEYEPGMDARSARVARWFYAPMLVASALTIPAVAINAWDGIYWAITSMTTLGSDIYPTTTGGQIVSVAVVLVGISFVALLTGAIAQRFLSGVTEPLSLRRRGGRRSCAPARPSRRGRAGW